MLDSVAPYVIAMGAMVFCAAAIWTIVTLVDHLERVDEAQAAEKKSAGTTM